MFSKGTVGCIAAGAGLAFIGYCVYFDHKRRNDPDFKMKLRERRRKARQTSRSPGNETAFPDLKDQEARQKLFLDEMQLGETLLGQGDIDGGVQHLSNGIVLCNLPQQLLQVLQQTIPPKVFQQLLQELPRAHARIAAQSLASTQMAEDEMD